MGSGLGVLPILLRWVPQPCEEAYKHTYYYPHSRPVTPNTTGSFSRSRRDAGPCLVEGFAGEPPMPGGAARTISKEVNNVASSFGYPTKKIILQSMKKQRQQ